MIFEIKSKTGVIEYAQAKDVLHLVNSYSEEYSGIEDVNSIVEITEEEAKTSPLRNTEYNEDDLDNDMPSEIMLFDLVCGDDFAIVASTEF